MSTLKFSRNFTKRRVRKIVFCLKSVSDNFVLKELNKLNPHKSRDKRTGLDDILNMLKMSCADFLTWSIVSVYMYVWLYVCMLCMYGWMDGWMDGWMYVCMYVCIYVYTRINCIIIISGFRIADEAFLKYSSIRTSCSMWAASWQNQQNDLCAQRRLRSAWASAQSDQSSMSALKTLGP